MPPPVAVTLTVYCPGTERLDTAKVAFATEPGVRPTTDGVTLSSGKMTVVLSPDDMMTGEAIALRKTPPEKPLRLLIVMVENCGNGSAGGM